jgi:hypothetical protein
MWSRIVMHAAEDSGMAWPDLAFCQSCGWIEPSGWRGSARGRIEEGGTMLKHLGERRPSASLVISTIALFVSLGGAGYAATGGNFILGQTNTATTPSVLAAPINAKTLRLRNMDTGADASALGLEVASGHPPFTVNSNTRVPQLNADLLDGRDSAAFLRKGTLQSMSVSGAGGVVDVLNTGTTNGVQGITQSPSASGVYGQNTSTGGFGVAGRAGDFGNAIYGDNTGTGFAGWFDDKVHLGGNLDCSGCVGASDINGKVNDSDQLDGIDSSGFVQGSGKAVGQALAENPGDHIFLGPPLAGFIRLSYACPSTLTNNGTLRVYNDSGGLANVFIDTGGGNPTYQQMAASGTTDLPASASGDSFYIQAQGGPGVETVQVATVHRASDCHAQAQGLLASSP